MTSPSTPALDAADIDTGIIGTIRTARQQAVRYHIGHEIGDVFGVDSDYDGATLTVEVADLADAQAMLTDLCASGRVRALTRAAGDESKAGWIVSFDDLQAIRAAAGDWGYDIDLEAVEAIALGVERRILAAMTPAPQHEGRVRAVMDAADRDADRCAERITELEAALEKACAETKRMDLARDQFLGERNMLAEALREIQRGDMTGMMELTEAEAARTRATWAIKRIGTPVAALTPAPQVEVATPTAQEAVPTEDELDEAWKSGFNAGFGEAMIAAHPPHPSETVNVMRAALQRILVRAREARPAHAVNALMRIEALAEEALRALKGGE